MGNKKIKAHNGVFNFKALFLHQLWKTTKEKYSIALHNV